MSMYTCAHYKHKWKQMKGKNKQRATNAAADDVMMRSSAHHPSSDGFLVLYMLFFGWDVTGDVQKALSCSKRPQVNHKRRATEFH